MDSRSGRFRVFRVVESVRHLNLYEVDAGRLYTVYETGYPDRQAAVDALRTGDLVEATLSGDPDADGEPWRFESLDRVGGVEMAFATDADPPAVAGDLWSDDQETPTYAVLTEDDEPVGACLVQPRAPLPNGAFAPNLVAGLVPMEAELASIPGVDEPAAGALFVDPDPPDATTYSVPFGVALLFTEAAEALPARFREAYDPTRGVDLDFDPYGV
ncbi:hypothetical protein BRC63_07385 [Halobacteriales archaeon QH_10_70_21]|nr:MAG: hypothetical protein BRC63_07385 [Halobacteriales archaeon QH_10_70_21]